jgi:uncharacterized membrane protein
MVGELAARVFEHLCSRDASRSWVLGGQVLPLCARCTGVYAGFALATLVVPLARFKPTRAVMWLHGAAMLQMVVFGFHLIGSQPPWLRTLSGSLFAAGAVYFLWLPYRARHRPEPKGGRMPYFAAVVAAQFALQAALRIDNAVAAVIVEILALAGIVAVLALAAISAIALVRTPRTRREAP